MHLVDGKYQLIDISKLGITWGDLRKTIQAMQVVVAGISMVVRASDFAWDSLDAQLKRAAHGFWVVPAKD